MKQYTVILILLLALSKVHGYLHIIEGFQAWAGGEIYSEAEEIGWQAVSETGTDEYWIIHDPENPDNTGLYIESGGWGTDRAMVWAIKELPRGGIAPGKTGTIFFDCYWTGPNTTFSIGTADLGAFDDIAGFPASPGEWSDFNTLINFGESGLIEHNDADGFVPTDPPMAPEMNTWYAFWIVVENTWDYSSSPPTSTGKYSIYMENRGSGDNLGPELVPVGTDPQKESAAFRRAPVDEAGNPMPISWLMIATKAPPQTTYPDLFILDNIYFHPREKLLVDIRGYDDGWMGHFLLNGILNTGDWLGWLDVYETPYIWSYTLNGWIYMAGDKWDTKGAWGYFFK